MSKRRVSAEEVVKCEAQYEKGKAVDSIVSQVAKKLSMDPETIYEKVIWPLGKQYGHAHDAFKLALTEANTVFAETEMDDALKTELLAVIARRLTPKPVKIRSDIELTCYSYEGINGIKAALRAGEAVSTEQVPIKIRLVAPPLYVMTTTSTDKTAAIELMEQALLKIEAEITKYEGSMNVAMRVSFLLEAMMPTKRVFLINICLRCELPADSSILFPVSSACCLLATHRKHTITPSQPKAVSESEDSELAKLMEQVERENAQVSGDEDSEVESD